MLCPPPGPFLSQPAGSVWGSLCSPPHLGPPLPSAPPLRAPASHGAPRVSPPSSSSSRSSLPRSPSFPLAPPWQCGPETQCRAQLRLRRTRSSGGTIKIAPQADAQSFSLCFPPPTVCFTDLYGPPRLSVLPGSEGPLLLPSVLYEEVLARPGPEVSGHPGPERFALSACDCATKHFQPGLWVPSHSRCCPSLPLCLCAGGRG